VDIAVLMGAERQRAEKELKESLMFEMKLANVSRIRGLHGSRNSNSDISILAGLHTKSEIFSKHFPVLEFIVYNTTRLKISKEFKLL